MWRTLCAGAVCGLLVACSAVAEGRGSKGPIPDAVWAKMQGVSWHADLPCPTRDELRLLTVPFVDFKGRTRQGELIVAADVADDMLDIFAEIHASGFAIQSMRPVYEFRGDDRFSMAANNTSAFNCRVVSGSTRLSQHAYGKAIDINPVQNPFVTRSTTSPKAGVDFDEAAERAFATKGIIVDGDAVVRAFKARGWGWGGDWTSLKDYQHFSENGN
jgi:hypothetical protein